MVEKCQVKSVAVAYIGIDQADPFQSGQEEDCGSHHLCFAKSWNGARDSLADALRREVVSTCLGRRLKLRMSTLSAESLPNLLFLAFEAGFVLKVASSNERHLKSFLYPSHETFRF